MRIRPFALSFSLLVLGACGPSDNGADDDGDDDSSGEPDARQYAPDAGPVVVGDGGLTGCTKIDILFVVDNSGSMGEEQTNLATNFPSFIDVIDQSGLDWHVAVTSTGVNYHYQMEAFPGLPPIAMDVSGGDNGAMLMGNSCGMTRRWVQKGDVGAATQFACAATLGTDGPGDEMPLAAMRAALEDRMADGTNAGWRRDDALLAVVFLTDENDCSYESSVTLSFAQVLCESQQEPVANYVAFLDAYTGARGKWAAATIAGPGPDRCSSDFGDADYCERLDQFTTQTGQNAVFSSICEGDLTAGLNEALGLFDAACDGFPPVE
jgi:hypothetical protein